MGKGPGPNGDNILGQKRDVFFPQVVVIFLEKKSCNPPPGKKHKSQRIKQNELCNVYLYMCIYTHIRPQFYNINFRNWSMNNITCFMISINFRQLKTYKGQTYSYLVGLFVPVKVYTMAPLPYWMYRTYMHNLYYMIWSYDMICFTP